MLSSSHLILVIPKLQSSVQKMMNNSKQLSQNNKRLTQDQVRLLEESFKGNNKLHPQRKLQLSHDLHIPVRQIAVWYQNRRARMKSQSLELDYGALENRLQTVLYQKRQLEKEVQQLRLELQISSECNEEGGSSNMNDQIDCAFDQASIVQDLFSFLMSN